ncbi:MAG: zinc metalloprotease [Chitinophagaceae bacterium]|uniref:zinc metalloprotease n=1 Tax=unclassified Paraflavitalea TaxID=2798305 RepID=UPI003D339E49|nr:zinc metalloprotease [Chitinophagaceae bacterium]
MRKLFGILALGLVFASACKKSSSDAVSGDGEERVMAPTSRACASYEVLQRQLTEDPTLADRMNAIESFTKRFVESPSSNRLLPDGTMEIPVVVNVVYRTAAENISLAQIQSQIDVLNEDFAATNADYANVTPFDGVKSGDTKIRFVLDQVIRVATSKRSFGTNDAVKKASGGGVAPTSPTTKLNIWSCTLANGILGYAQFPGGAAATDGVVILNTAFGRVGTVVAPFNKGRTATHEVGHWLNLRHIWGDATCGNDQVGDTPLHNTANYGCPAAGHRSTCTGTPVEMTMNYMDYTDDACMYMFSAGQKARMQATYAVGGPRASFR